MKKVLAVILSLSLVLLDIPPFLVLADDSDIFGKDVQPNVMLLIDTSDSMNTEINVGTPIPYNYNTGFCEVTEHSCSPTYSRYVVYKRTGSNYTVYANSIAEVNNASARTALQNNGFWSGRISGSRVNLFLGNYLNYLACDPCDGKQAKIAIARNVLKNIIQNVEGVRFGAMKFAAGGGAMIEPIRDMTDTNKTTLMDAIGALDAPGGVGTPTGGQMRHAGQYYAGSFGSYSSPIQYACQPNFVIVISDGLYTGSGNDPRPAATELYTTDHRTDLFNPTLQNVIVHTIGFSIDPDDRNVSPTCPSGRKGADCVLEQAAQNGGGSFYPAENTTELEQALQDAIRQIVAATFSFASPVIPTTSTSGSNRAYLASFKSDPSRSFWQGHLKAYNRNSDGTIPVDSTTKLPLDSALAWNAGQKLSDQASPVRPASDRKIYTWVNGSRQEFLKSTTDLNTTVLAAADSTERDKIIDYIRGAVDFNDEDADSDTTEERPWKLGDIFHSTPVVVTPPFFPSTDSSYNAFKSAKAGRPTVLIVGANDGMLHAFKETDGVAPAEDGKELWAFIPPDLLSRLKELTVRSGEHPFYVDSSPIAADVKINGAWKTVVVFGLRRGGEQYYALDITDTTNPLFLWSRTDSEMGETWSEPAIGRIKLSGGGEKFVAFVGGGYDTAQNNSSGRAFYVIDIENGNILWKYYNNSNSDDRRYMNFSLAANPRAVDKNNDGFVDLVYIGDVGGQLWKFDVSAEATISGGVITNWDPAQKGKRLFAAASAQANPPATGEYYPAQAIYAAPAAALDSSRNLWIYFGTGDRNHPNNTTAPNRFYGIKDNTTMTNGNLLTQANLADVTTDATAAAATAAQVAQGWHVGLGTDEKVLAPADVFAKIVFFTTFTPTTTATCGGGGGVAKLYGVDMFEGNAVINLATGVSMSGRASASAVTVGGGIPSRPIIIITESGNTGIPTVITGTTNQQISHNLGAGSGGGGNVNMRRLVGWREVF